MSKIGFIFIGFIIVLNIMLTIGSNVSLNNIDLKLISAQASWWPETDPASQIDFELDCVITTYGCFECGGGDGLCIVTGVQIVCVDQYVCPSCTCNPQECTAVYQC